MPPSLPSISISTRPQNPQNLPHLPDISNPEIRLQPLQRRRYNPYLRVRATLAARDEQRECQRGVFAVLRADDELRIEMGIEIRTGIKRGDPG